MIAHSERAHALLSASGAARWLNCTPSARLEETFPETTSAYAEEGTLAHEVAEAYATRALKSSMTEEAFNTRIDMLKAREGFTEDMLRHADDYASFLEELVNGHTGPLFVAIEARLDFSHIAPAGFGTADCVIVSDDKISVIDYKYGRGVEVEVKDNPQLQIYALAALEQYGWLYKPETVAMIIYQPRTDNISQHDMPTAELLAWGQEIKGPAEKAFRGAGEYNPGDWCRFCSARAACRARSEQYLKLSGFCKKKPPTLEEAELGEVLEQARGLVAWVEDVEAYALGAILAGKAVKGWKAVEGRSNRAFTDVDAAFAELQKHGTDATLLYERRPITLTATEALLGKTRFCKLLADYIIKPPGKPTLVPAADKREAMTTIPTAEQAFGDNKK